MAIEFPHAGDKAVQSVEVVSAWIQYCQLAFHCSDWQAFTMPINHVKNGIPKHPGFDSLCRILVGGGYVHTMQATDQFFEQNRARFLKVRKGTTNAGTGRSVHGVRLTPAAISEWESEKERRNTHLDNAERMLLADQEDEGRDEPISADTIIPRPDSADSHRPAVTQNAAHDLSFPKLVESLVDSIHNAPFQAYYRGRPIPRALASKGWQQRHDSYFWPNPNRGFAENAEETAKFVSRFVPLAQKIMPSIVEITAPTPVLERVWDAACQKTAKNLALEIFTWGGVPQNGVTEQKVFEVACNAAAGRIVFRRALMNSGWTKVAAFASEALPSMIETQAIWDSRVSTAIIGNLDEIVNPSAPSLANLELRIIPGRGGSRPAVQSALRSKGWRYGWGGNRAWAAPFTGAKIVKEICTVLNANLKRFGAPSESNQWSNRSVEMALFMEGY